MSEDKVFIGHNVQGTKCPEDKVFKDKLSNDKLSRRHKMSQSQNV